MALSNQLKSCTYFSHLAATLFSVPEYGKKPYSVLVSQVQWRSCKRGERPPFFNDVQMEVLASPPLRDFSERHGLLDPPYQLTLKRLSCRSSCLGSYGHCLSRHAKLLGAKVRGSCLPSVPR